MARKGILSDQATNFSDQGRSPGMENTIPITATQPTAGKPPGTMDDRSTPPKQMRQYNARPGKTSYGETWYPTHIPMDMIRQTTMRTKNE